MDYSKIMSELGDASLFDLYRLRVAINTELDNPERMLDVKRMIHVGDAVSYFDENENRLVQAEVIECKRTRALVKNQHDGKLWNIPFYMINIEKVPADISYPAKATGLSRQEVKIGDLVGFRSEKYNKDIRGRVIRINPKTVTIFVEPRAEWRVAYSMLYRIIDGEKALGNRFIEGVVVDRKPTGPLEDSPCPLLNDSDLNV